MTFKKYMHLERFGTSEVDGIELGNCYIFPKIDGTNASLWLKEDGTIGAGSRKRELSLEEDNQGFYKWALEQDHILDYLKNNPIHRLFGEWLVPHSLKTYRDSAWRIFYVFDVAIDKSPEEILHEGDSKIKYLHFEEYSKGLEEFGINYILPISIIEFPTKEQLYNQLDRNVYLIKDGEGVGEGVVIKRYDFKNKFNRQVWAKIVSSEFKEKHTKEQGPTKIVGKSYVEREIVDKYVTKALCEKTYSKIQNDGGFSSKNIPQLLNTVYYDLVREDCWNFVKEFKNPTIDFKLLQRLCFEKVKINLPNLF